MTLFYFPDIDYNSVSAVRAYSTVIPQCEPNELAFSLRCIEVRCVCHVNGDLINDFNGVICRMPPSRSALALFDEP